MPNVCDGDAQVFSKSALTIDPHAVCVLAQVPSARKAVATLTADEVPLARHELALIEAQLKAAEDAGGAIFDGFPRISRYLRSPCP